MKFYTLCILPKEINILDDVAINAAVAQVMAPFDQSSDEYGFARAWDYFLLCRKENSEEWFSAFNNVVSESEYIVFPADSLVEDGVTHTLATPKKEWFSMWDYEETTNPNRNGQSWDTEVVRIAREFTGHYCVLLHCHG